MSLAGVPFTRPQLLGLHARGSVVGRTQRDQAISVTVRPRDATVGGRPHRVLGSVGGRPGRFAGLHHTLAHSGAWKAATTVLAARHTGRSGLGLDGMLVLYAEAGDQLGGGAPVLAGILAQVIGRRG